MSSGLLVKPFLFFSSPASILQKTRLVPSRGGMCVAFVGLAPTSAQGINPVGFRIRPQGSSRSCRFHKIAGWGKGRDFHHEHNSF